MHIHCSIRKSRSDIHFQRDRATCEVVRNNVFRALSTSWGKATVCRIPFSPTQRPRLLQTTIIFRGRKQYISSAVCISLQYFTWCIPHTIPVFVGFISTSISTIAAKNKHCLCKMGVVNLQYSGLCWLNRMCLTLSHHLEPSRTKRVYCSLLAVAQLRLTSWNIRKDSISHLASVDLSGRLRFNGGLQRAWLTSSGPALARKVGRPTEYDEVAPCLHFFAPSVGFRVRVWKCVRVCNSTSH